MAVDGQGCVSSSSLASKAAARPAMYRGVFIYLLTKSERLTTTLSQYIPYSSLELGLMGFSLSLWAKISKIGNWKSKPKTNKQNHNQFVLLVKTCVYIFKQSPMIAIPDTIKRQQFNLPILYQHSPPIHPPPDRTIISRIRLFKSISIQISVQMSTNTKFIFFTPVPDAIKVFFLI